MPAFTLEATADSGNNDAWALGAGTTKWQAMADSDDGTYIQRTPGTQRQGFVTENLPGEAVAIVGSVTVNMRGKDVTVTADTCAASIWYSSTDYDRAGQDFTTSIVDYPKAFANLSGTPFTPAIINASEIGVHRLAGTSNTMNVYKLNMTGNYQVGGGGFSFLVVGLIGAMLGGGILIGDMPGIVSAVQQADPANSLITPGEVARAYAELKAHPHRRYF